MKTDLFQSCGHCWVFQMCWHIECGTFTASSFRIWNSSTGIPSPPLALFVVMLSKAHLTSHSGMSGSRSVITPSFKVYLQATFLDMACWVKRCMCACEVTSGMSDSLWSYTGLACQAPLSMGFSRQEYWSGLPSSSRGSFPPRDWSHLLCLLHWEAAFLPLAPPGKPRVKS